MHSATRPVASSPALTPGHWSIDPNHSAITFAIRHLGLSKVRGRFRAFDVFLDIGPSTTDFEVVANIDLASIDTSNPDRDAHVRSTDFFNVDQHPTMTFRSTRIEPTDDGYTMTGDLTLNGVTRSVTRTTPPFRTSGTCWTAPTATHRRLPRPRSKLARGTWRQCSSLHDATRQLLLRV